MDFFKSFIDAQQTMMNSWQDMYKNIGGLGKSEENPYAKSMQGFLDMQKKYFDALSAQKAFEPAAVFGEYFKLPGFDPKAFEFFTGLQKAYFDQMNNWAEAAKPFGFPQTSGLPFDMSKLMDMSTWTEGIGSMNQFMKQLQQVYSPLVMGKSFEPEVKTLLEKIMQANTYYLNLYKFWKEFEEAQVRPAAEEIKKYTENMLKKYEQTFSDMLLPMIPAELRSLVQEPAELMKSFAKTLSGFFAPWAENADELRDLFVEGMASDTKKLASFFELWKSQFDQTFGALLLSPTVGSAKDLVEQQNKAFETFLNFGILSIDFSARITAVHNENLGSIVSKYFDMVEEGSQPKTLQEFFDYWSAQVEKVFESYFATDEFSKLIGEISAAAMDYRIETNKLIERYLSDTPIVTRTEMNSLYKTVYELKKDVKAIKKELEPPASDTAKEVGKK